MKGACPINETLTLQWITATWSGSALSQLSMALQMVQILSRGGACMSGQPVVGVDLLGAPPGEGHGDDALRDVRQVQFVPLLHAESRDFLFDKNKKQSRDAGAREWEGGFVTEVSKSCDKKWEGSNKHLSVKSISLRRSISSQRQNKQRQGTQNPEAHPWHWGSEAGRGGGRAGGETGANGSPALLQLRVEADIQVSVMEPIKPSMSELRSAHLETGSSAFTTTGTLWETWTDSRSPKMFACRPERHLKGRKRFRKSGGPGAGGADISDSIYHIHFLSLIASAHGKNYDPLPLHRKTGVVRPARIRFPAIIHRL
ncbi:hypothetical protein EYF80_013999 [Liparis tanakae]|uniref:Uncharacterized protein n=1 Tax=Liparis tanakae TaxID=230148 RepID=A0A4Z2IEV2_9TELE|nr:hypothetical protein EYF80_013999 [Liparis tanakae]